MFALKNKFGYFGGMVYHAECGWHAGFGGSLDDKETIYYSTLEQAKEQLKFLNEMFHERGVDVVDIIETLTQDKEVIVW
jgi:hypothetical protein